MGLILDIIVISACMMFLLPFLGGLAMMFRIRRHLRNPFDARPDDPNSHIPGDVIEGEYKVLDEKEKK